jgi:uncharacterized protein
MYDKRPSRRKILKLGAAGAVGLILGEMVLEPNRIEKLRITVPIKDLPEEFVGYRLGVMSDIHWRSRIDEEFLGRACQELMSFKPDVIALPGDFFHGRDRRTGDRPTFKGAIESLDAPDGVFGTLGNHDHWTGSNFVRDQIANHSKVQLVDNRSRLVERNGRAIAIGGVGDLWEDKVLLAQAFKGVDPGIPRILISHNPDIAQALDDKETRVDLQVSGHTHGGQFCIPGIYSLAGRVSQFGDLFREGLVTGARHRVFVSKGIGRPHGVRFCAPPDVACLELVSA